MRFLTMLFPNRCPYCNAVIEPEKPVCDECSFRFDPKPYIQRLPNGCTCISAFEHSGIQRKMMLDFKLHKKKHYYKSFAAVINILVKNEWGDIHFDYYTSVPAHKTKIRIRGYDQTKIIAESAADLNRCKYRKLLVQVKNNRPQRELNAQERRENVGGVYPCSGKCDISGKTILIIDDVITTGSTLLECTNILLENGAKAVCCATVNCRSRSDED